MTERKSGQAGSRPTADGAAKAWLIYDGQCPLCRRYAHSLDVRRAVGALRRPFRPQAGSRPTADGAAKAWLIYDGQCPLCRRYAHSLDVRRAVGELVLVDAREGGPLVEELRRLPHDLNDGMALKMNGRFYLGRDALHALARMPARRGLSGAANRLLFGSRWAASAGYPMLKLARRGLLRLKGVPPLED